MKTNKMLQLGLVWMACVGMCAPSIAFAGNPTSSTRPRDVTLQADGQLMGRVVDAAGNELAGETLAVFSNSREIARVSTDDNGQFQVRNLRGGVHQIVTRGSVTVLRLWSIGTAPPAAANDVLLVSGAVVRGQFSSSGQPGCQGGCGLGASNGTVYYADGAGCGGSCDSGCYGYDHAAGQGGHHAARGAGLWGRPLLIGGIIAAAVAIPVALADDDDDPLE